MFCLSLFLVHRVSVLEGDIRSLQRDIILQLNQPRSDRVNGKMDRMSQTREHVFSEDTKLSAFQTAHSSLRTFLRRVKREQNSDGGLTSILALTARGNSEPEIRGNTALIPWTISVQQGNAISLRGNKIVVQEDGYYLVFGQVLFEGPNKVMGHVIQKWSSMKSGTSTQLLHCLQEMSAAGSSNTCHTAGIAQLRQGDELELVIPDRPNAIITMDAESTFFGVIQMK